MELGRLASPLVAAVLALAVSACGGAERDAAEPESAGRAEPARAGEGGVTVVLPPGWHAATPDDGDIVDPVTRLAVASGPIRASESPCQIASYDFADDAVASSSWSGTRRRRGRRGVPSGSPPMSSR